MLGPIVRILLVMMLTMQISGAPADGTSYFAARRQVLMKKIEGSVAVLQGAAETRAYERFRQSNDFYYLTGVETPGAYVLIDAVEKRAILFLPPRDPRLEVWEGPRLYPGDEARNLTGFDEVLETAKLGAELEKRKKDLKHLYTPLKAEETAATSRDRAAQFDYTQERSPWDGRVSRAKAFEQNLHRTLGESLSVKDLSPILDGMRRIKDDQEIGRMRESARIGARGMQEAIRATKPGLYEYQIAALAEFYFKSDGAMGPAYFPVVGSGPNSCILHYHANARRTEAGDMVVMDFGPDYQYYHCDITRSFPVTGVFTPEQAKVYQAVLESQKAALRAARPGATFRSISEAAREIIVSRGYGQYWRHSVSHYVGMSTHDVGSLELLEPGVVITIEPGIYLSEHKLGVRIEDTVLVTKGGCEVLSNDVPKEIQDIERLMANKAGTFPR
jgi:Xaa-Pro aminopeptidase